MRLLGIDTAANSCSAAVWSEGGFVASRRQEMNRGHAETIIPMIQDVLSDGGIDFDSLDGLAVTVGPGSFTGLRTGLAAARGLALATGLPLAGFSTLEVVAHAALPEAVNLNKNPANGAHCLVALETRRSNLFIQLFTSDAAALEEPVALRPEAVAALLPPQPLILAGDGVPRLKEYISGHGRNDVCAAPMHAPDAEVVASLAARRWAVSGPVVGPPPSPIYVHPPEATIPIAEGRLRQ